MKANQNKIHWGFPAGIAVCVLGFAIFIKLGLDAWHIGDKALAGSHDLGALGNYGSYLQGTTASLWAVAGTFLTLIAIIASLWQLSLQRGQLASQDEQLNAQLETLKLQNFESSFFQLLNLQGQITTALHSPGRQTGAFAIEELNGRKCFERFYTQFASTYQAANEPLRSAIADKLDQGSKAKADVINVATAYSGWFRRHQQDLGHYFRNLYHIIKFIKDTNLPNPRRYTSLARAQLSAYELALLFYDGLSPYGVKFKPLIEEFGMLEHLDRGLLLDKSHAEWYAPSAYK